MTTRSTTHATCGNCGRESEQAIVMSTNAFGPPDLDLRPPEGERSTMDTWLQACPACGHVAADLAEAPSNPAVLTSAPDRAALASAAHPPTARRFRAFALATEATPGPDPEAAAHARLHAVWAFDDAGQPAPAAASRRDAAAAFARVTTPENAAARGALTTDALRRAGDLPAAATACTAALALTDAVDFIARVLHFQQTLIARGDTATHTLDEVEEGTGD